MRDLRDWFFPLSLFAAWTITAAYTIALIGGGWTIEPRSSRPPARSYALENRRETLADLRPQVAAFEHAAAPCVSHRGAARRVVQ